MKTEEITSTIIKFENIKPINTVEEGIRQGHYSDYYKFITDETVKLKPETGEKTIYTVGFNRTIGETEYIDLLRRESKKPCTPNYMLGLMAQVREEKMPPKLRNKYIVAAEPNSVFTDRRGFHCFLCVDRFDVYRRLSLSFVGRGWDDGYVFLAEDLVS